MSQQWREPDDLVSAEDPSRCRQVAGRCERAHHEGDRHYTSYGEGVWRWRLDALNLALAHTNGDLGLALTEALIAGDELAAHLRRVRDLSLVASENPRTAEVLEAWERVSRPTSTDAREVAPTSVGESDG